MENTSNYGLKRWDGEDRILVEEFNDNWDKIDTALKSNAEAVAAETAAREAGISALQTALTSCGNCKIVTGSYTGTGKYGSGNKNSLTFPFEPKLVIVQNKSKAMPELGASDTHQYGMLLAIRGLAQYVTSAYPFILSWEGNTLRWYSEYNERLQLNVSGQAYCYLAIG